MYAVESRVVFLNKGNTVPIVIYSVQSRIVITNIKNTFPVKHLHCAKYCTDYQYEE
jgi:hypothetical protein